MWLDLFSIWNFSSSKRNLSTTAQQSYRIIVYLLFQRIERSKSQYHSQRIPHVFREKIALNTLKGQLRNLNKNVKRHQHFPNVASGSRIHCQRTQWTIIF